MSVTSSVAVAGQTSTGAPRPLAVAVIDDVAVYTCKKLFPGAFEISRPLPSAYANLEPRRPPGFEELRHVRCIAWANRCIYVGELCGPSFKFKGAPDAFHLGIIRVVYPDTPFCARTATPYWDMCVIDSVSQTRMTERLVTLIGAGLRMREIYQAGDLHHLVGHCIRIGQPVSGGVRVTRPAEAKGVYISRTEFVPDQIVTSMAYEIAAAHGTLACPGSCCQTAWIEPPFPPDPEGIVPIPMPTTAMRHIQRYTHPVVLALSSEPDSKGVYVFDTKFGDRVVPCVVLDIHPCFVCATRAAITDEWSGIVPLGPVATTSYVGLQPPRLVCGGTRIHVPLDHAWADDSTAGIVATYLRALRERDRAINPSARA